MQSVKKCVTGLLIFFSLSLNSQEFRTYDGSGNNLDSIEWGMHGAQILREVSVGYSDGISQLDEENRPTPRNISNKVFQQDQIIADPDNHSDFVWVFGQFLDHDVSLVESSSSFDEALMMVVPQDDDYFVPGSGIFMFRSEHIEGTGTEVGNPREYSNLVTSFIDASMVYGSTEERALWLRTLSGDGKLKTSEGNLMPWNTFSGEFNDTGIDGSTPFMADDTNSGGKMFVAGDVRANENPLLIVLHTTFVREHNRLCEQYAEQNPSWTGEQIYQKARKMVGAYVQSITYYEWLPSIGINLPTYNGYRPDINPGITNTFSAAAFRMGHTLIGSDIIRMDNEGEEISQGNIDIASSFFNPTAIVLAGGIEPYLKGMATQVQQDLDCKIINDIRNFLFGTQLDLASININRGRERGLPDYNTMRSDYGFPMLNNFNDLTELPENAQVLEDLYGDINELDAWVGLLAEKHLEGSMFGELESYILEQQFQYLREGDRFYFENDPGLSSVEKEEIRNTKFHDIIMRNAEISAMQQHVFTAMPHDEIPEGPALLNVHLESVVFPNPANGATTIKINSQLDTPVEVAIYNVHGQRIFLLNDRLTEGANYLNLKFEENWLRGYYNILIKAGEKYTIQKLIIE